MPYTWSDHGHDVGPSQATMVALYVSLLSLYIANELEGVSKSWLEPEFVGRCKHLVEFVPAIWRVPGVKCNKAGHR